MKIFDQEKLDGLESAIKASASFSYASLVAPASVSEKSNINKHFKSLFTRSRFILCAIYFSNIVME